MWRTELCPNATTWVFGYSLLWYFNNLHQCTLLFVLKSLEDWFLSLATQGPGKNSSAIRKRWRVDTVVDQEMLKKIGEKGRMFSYSWRSLLFSVLRHFSQSGIKSPMERLPIQYLPNDCLSTPQSVLGEPGWLMSFLCPRKTNKKEIYSFNKYLWSTFYVPSTEETFAEEFYLIYVREPQACFKLNKLHWSIR